MLKKSMFGSFLATLLVGVLLIGCTFASAAEIRNQKFRFSYPNTRTSITGVGFEQFAKTVAELSGGKMIIETFPSGSLVSNAEALDAVSMGNVDFALFMPSNIIGTIKEITIYDIPGALAAGKHMELYTAARELLMEIFAKYNLKYCAPVESGTDCFLAIDGFIKSPADLKGKAVRASGTWVGKAVTAWGGSPVNVALGDIATALERKTVAACFAGWIVAGPNKIYESAPYVSWTSLRSSLTGFMMNLDRWNSLNDAEQAVLQTGFDNFINEIAELAVIEREKIMKEVEASGGHNYILSPEENAAFTAVTPELVKETRAISGELGNRLIDAVTSVK